MDAFWKCLLACVMSLVPTASAINSEHLISDRDAAAQFVSHREKYQDVVLNLLIENNPPAHFTQDAAETKSASTRRVDDQMKELGIDSITSTDSEITLVIDKKGSTVKELVWHPYAFAKVANVNHETKADVLCRLDDDWAIATVALARPTQ